MIYVKQITDIEGWHNYRSGNSVDSKKENSCTRALVSITMEPLFAKEKQQDYWNGYRVLKWWRHKSQISEIMGFVRIFWKNNVQEAYLPKMSIQFRANCLWDVNRLYSENSIQTLLIFYRSTENFIWFIVRSNVRKFGAWVITGEFNWMMRVWGLSDFQNIKVRLENNKLKFRQMDQTLANKPAYAIR